MRLKSFIVVPGRGRKRVSSFAQVGREIWAGSGSATVTVFDEGGNPVRQTEAPSKGGSDEGDDSASFLLRVGGFVWCGSTDGAITVFNSRTVAIRQLEGHLGAVTCAAASARFVWTGSADCSICAWDRRTGDLRATLHGHTNWVRCVASVGLRVWSGSDDCTIRVWKEDSAIAAVAAGGGGGEPHVTLEGHSGGVLSLLVVGRTVWSGSADRTIRVWDAQGSRALDVLRGHSGWVTCLALKDGFVWSGSLDRTVRVWNATNFRCVEVLRGHTSAIWSIFACEGIPQVWTGAGDSSICVWETPETTTHPEPAPSTIEEPVEEEQEAEEERVTADASTETEPQEPVPEAEAEDQPEELPPFESGAPIFHAAMARAIARIRREVSSSKSNVDALS